MQDLERVAVVGAGISGQSSLRLLRAAGVAEQALALFDDTPGKGAFHEPARLLREFCPARLIVSPGVPLTTPWLRDFAAAGGRLMSELELACSYLEHESVVAVTGSVGKSTTVSLLGAGARVFCPDAFVGGNLGTPLSAYIADVLTGQRRRTAQVVLELSSYQLELSSNLRCAGSAVTALMPNHLDRYASLEAYYATKWKLVEATGGPVVLNENGGDLKAYATRHPSGFTRFMSARTSPLPAGVFRRAKLMGAHNHDNLAVASTLARLLRWPDGYLEGMLAFPGLAHRLQDAGVHAGVRFINDSKATAIESVQTAVQAVLGSTPASHRVWVMLGGKDKKLPWSNLAALQGDARLGFVFFGQCGELARQDSGLPGEAFAKMGEALRHLRGRAAAGDSVLLSPGGSSLDEFKNFEERGDAFMRAAKELFA